MSEYDVIIIGSGPGGLTAGIYSTRYMLKTLIIGKDYGRLADAHMVENFPGYKGNGLKLVEGISAQCKELGAEITRKEAVEIKKNGELYEVTLSDNTKHSAKALILALGLKNLKLNVEGEKEFMGKGVSYCPVCDGAFFKEKTVALVGSGNAAVSSAVMLAQHASKVIIIHRKENMKAQPVWLERAHKNPKISFKAETIVKKVEGKDSVEGIIVESKGKEEKIKLEGLFIEIGAIPSTTLLSGIQVKTNKQGFVLVDDRMTTSAERVYAAGDLADKNLTKQAIEACSQGAVAATSAYMDLKKEGLA